MVGFDVHLFKPFVDGSSEVGVKTYDDCKTCLRINPGLELHMVHNHLCRVQNKILLPYILTNCFEIREDLFFRCYFVTQLAIGRKCDYTRKQKKIPYLVKCLRVFAPTVQDDTFLTIWTFLNQRWIFTSGREWKDLYRTFCNGLTLRTHVNKQKRRYYRNLKKQRRFQRNRRLRQSRRTEKRIRGGRGVRNDDVAMQASYLSSRLHRVLVFLRFISKVVFELLEF